MNRVYDTNGKEITDDTRALIYALGFNSNKYFGKIFPGEMKERIQGKDHCACYGDGEFVLYPVDHPMVVDGKKRYMECRKCGCVSHL